MSFDACAFPTDRHPQGLHTHCSVTPPNSLILHQFRSTPPSDRRSIYYIVLQRIFFFHQTAADGCCYAGLRPTIPEFAPLRRHVAHTVHKRLGSTAKSSALLAGTSCFGFFDATPGEMKDAEPSRNAELMRLRSGSHMKDSMG